MVRLSETLLERESLDGVQIRRIVAGLPLDEEPAATDNGRETRTQRAAAKPLKRPAADSGATRDSVKATTVKGNKAQGIDEGRAFIIPFAFYLLPALVYF